MKEMVRELVTPTTAALQRRMQLALGALRGVTLTWSAVVCAIDAQSGVLDRPTAAAALLAVLAAWSAVWTAGVHRRDRWVSGVTGIVVDLALACVAIGADHWVYDGTHPQSFASAWPVVAVVATGVGAGAWWGLAGGTAVGVANVIGASMIGTGMDGAWLSSWGSLVLIAASGWVGGWVAERLRTTAQAAADAQARADVARTLHDGVLQTLAVIQRRSDDADLVALAKEQDAELRTFLRGEYTASTTDRPHAPDGSGDHHDHVDHAGHIAPDDHDSHDDHVLSGRSGTRSGRGTRDLLDIAARLRSELARVGRAQQVDVQLVVIDPGSAKGPAADALIGATAEAVVNAAKHAQVQQVWVSVDRRLPSGTMVVVHDEGAGFDPDTTPEGTGLTASVRGRLALVDGGATITSRPGKGTDVTMWAP